MTSGGRSWWFSLRRLSAARVIERDAAEVVPFLEQAREARSYAPLWTRLSVSVIRKRMKEDG